MTRPARHALLATVLALAATAAVAQTPGGPGYLAGVKLSTAKTGNGWGEEHRVTFCSDGSFTHFKQFLSLSQFGSGNTARTERGRWQIVSQGGQDVLVARFNDGRVLSGPV